MVLFLKLVWDGRRAGAMEKIPSKSRMDGWVDGFGKGIFFQDFLDGFGFLQDIFGSRCVFYSQGDPGPAGLRGDKGIPGEKGEKVMTLPFL